MNGKLFLSASSFLLKHFMVQCVFLLFFSFKDFQCIGWICYSRLTCFVMGCNLDRFQEHDTVHGEQPSDESGTKKQRVTT